MYTFKSWINGISWSQSCILCEIVVTVLKQSVQEMMEIINKEELIDKLIYELPMLRARLGMAQDEASDIIGVSRQTYSSIETRKRNMSWTTYMALLMVFYNNPATRSEVENAGLFPEELQQAVGINHRE